MLRFHISFILSLLAICSLILNADAEDLLKVKLSLLSGDVYTAEVLSWSEEGLEIRHLDLIGSLTLRKDRLLNVQLLESRDTKKNNGLKSNQEISSILIRYSDSSSSLDDTIRGRIVQNNANEIILDTDFAGQVKVPRSRISKVSIEEDRNFLYQGPVSLEDWHCMEGAKGWYYNAGSIYCEKTDAEIVMGMKLVDECRFSFDLEWKKDPSFKVNVFTEDQNVVDSGSGYGFGVYRDPFAVTMTKVIDGKKMVIERNVDIQKVNFLNLISVSKKAHYDIYMDKNIGIAHVFVNGVHVGSYKDPNLDPGKLGQSVRLISLSNDPIRVSNIGMSRWDGVKPSSKVSRKRLGEHTGEGEQILLTNADVVIGKTGLISGGLMSVQTGLGAFKIPVKSIVSIVFRNSLKRRFKRSKDEIKLYYRTGGSIVVKPISFEGDKLKVFHDLIGEKVFDINAFKQIDLNIYSEEHEVKRYPKFWRSSLSR